MRDYSKVSPKFWIGKTGKALRRSGPEALIVGLYIMTAPTANMLGLYYLQISSIANETGLGLEGATKGLQSAIEAGFCAYDHESEMVWVYEMAQYQIAESLTEKDLRVKGVQNEYDGLLENPYLEPFFDKYHDAFLMSKKRIYESPLQAPCKPLASQEQEQEQEQEQKTGARAEQVAPAIAAASKKPETETRETWFAYSDAYRNRYGIDPVRNAKVNGQIFNFVKRLGREESPHVARFFVGHNNGYYVREMHSADAMLKDAEKLRTEWATNTKMTNTKANQADKTQTNLDAFGPLLAAALAKEQAELEAANAK
jgi:hypothetical protein